MKRGVFTHKLVSVETEFMEYYANGNITVLSRYGTYGGQFGQTDYLQMSYAGNRLTGVYDVVGHPVSAGTFGFRNGTGLNRYGYDNCGALLHDANSGIALIDYDDRGMPVRIQFTDGSVTEHVYASDGRRLRMRHLTAVEGLSVALKSRHELTESETLTKDSVDYMGNFQVIGNRVRRFDFADGYATYRQNVPAEVLDFHFFVRDHQGSVTAVIGRESAEQLTRYYPFGGLMTQDCMGEGVSADKYTGKRLDRMHGLDWYDFGARQYDPVYGRFSVIDPLCEKYPHLSPYAYCENDPVNFVDPDGRIIMIHGDGTDGSLELLRQFGGKKVNFYYDKETGNLTYSINLNKKGKPYKLNKQLRNLLSIIDDQSVTVNIIATTSPFVYDGDEQLAFIGGAFGGNNIADDGHITATQVINPTDLKEIGDYTSTDPIIHEITEAYGGAQISRKNGVGSPRSGLPGSVYKKAHENAYYKQNFEIKKLELDSSGKIAKTPYDIARKEYWLFRNNDNSNGLLLRRINVQ